MKSIKFTIAILALISLIGYSCYDDKGNYNYMTLNTITIDTNGYKSGYSIDRYDTLKIEPKVYFNDQLVNGNPDLLNKFDYFWTIYNAYIGGAVTYRNDTLSKEIKLDTIIPQPAESWILLFTVSEKETGIKEFIKFNINVDETVSDGWLILYEKEGNTDVALLANSRVKNNIVKERFLVDLYSNSNDSERLLGKPIAIVHSNGPISSGEVLIASEYDMVGVDRNNFEKTYDFEDLFWSAPREKNLSFLNGSNLRKEVVINNNRIHYIDYATSMVVSRANTAFNDACTGTYGELANWIPSYYANDFNAILYDKTNQRFLCVERYGTSVIGFTNQIEGAEFDVNNVGMEFIASDYGRNNYEYSLMRNGNEYALLVSNFSNTNPYTNNIAISKRDMSSCPEIDKASSITASVPGEFIFYSSPNALYTFKYNSGNNAEKVWDSPSGEEITCVRIQKSHISFSVFLPNINAVLYIATWNESTQEGSVYQMFIDPSSGTLDIDSQIEYTGLGKVKDMSWKWTTSM